MIGQFYRSFREFDSYTDEECERMVWEARARRADAMWVIPLAVMAPIFLMVIALALVLGRRVGWDAGLGAGLILMALTGGTVWIWVRRALILRSMLLHLTKAKCPYCLFDLRGLVAEAGRVVCPECGQRIVLADEGLTAMDLLVEKTHRTWRGGNGKVRQDEAIPLAEPPRRKQEIRVEGGRDGRGG